MQKTPQKFNASGSLLPPQKFRTRKKSFVLILSVYVAVTSCKKSETLHALIFNGNLKTLFWIQFGPLVAQKQGFLPKCQLGQF